ncbi:ROK family protein [Nocardia huaxiensis]|uniref:ROK family protein n=1 Tax=Nocardia huaxiensis TaxID=2755382 RepID=A0A7D6Z409_9NOCA|nr:ROK family protein [Nocardia huaxiensis]QLY32246.1 ROK family protein [Nocardia huaxiensis]UFS94048.1 ROK family protein [Nocardia huaxiensis]
MTVLALDIGATKFAAGTVDSNGVVTNVRRIAAPRTGVWDACRELMLTVADGAEVTAVGIGSAGPVDVRTGTTGPINIPEWAHGFELVDAVGKLFPQADIRFAIDGVCLALAEQRWGAARGIPSVLAMTVSSGIGGGIISEGRVVVGRTGNAGHIGHIIVPGNEEPCACGGSGCVEAVASGPSSVRWARRQGWTGDTGVELAAAAQAGDEIAVAALHRAGTALGHAIASAAALLDTHFVVIGGGFAQSGEPLWQPLRETVARHARLAFLRELRVLPSELTDQATIMGAGLLVGG